MFKTVRKSHGSQSFDHVGTETHHNRGYHKNIHFLGNVKNNNYNNRKLLNTIIVLVDYVVETFNNICSGSFTFYDVKQSRQI